MAGLDVYGRVLKPFLQASRFPAPEWAFISHANSDHYSAMPGLLADHRLGVVCVNEYFGRPGARATVPEAETDILGKLTAGAERLIRLSPAATGRIALDDRTSVEVLWPPAGRTDLDVNDTSLVLRVTCDDKTVLLTGDASKVAQEELAAADARADVLLMPHHGGWTDALGSFVRAVDPDVVIVSSAWDPSRRPGASAERRALFARLTESTRYVTTARNGWVRVRFGAAGLDVQTMR